MEKVLVCIEKMEQGKIEFSLSKPIDITAESFKVFDILENKIVSSLEYVLSRNNDNYVLDFQGKRDFYFYIATGYILSNFIYIFRKSTVFNGDFIYNNLPIPKESFTEVSGGKGLFKNNQMENVMETLTLSKAIDVEKSYFVVESKDDVRVTLKVYLYSEDKSPLNGEYRLRVSKGSI